MQCGTKIFSGPEEVRCRGCPLCSAAGDGVRGNRERPLPQSTAEIILTPDRDYGATLSSEDLDKSKAIIESRLLALQISPSNVSVGGNDLVLTVPENRAVQASTVGELRRLDIRPVTGSTPVALTDKESEQKRSDMVPRVTSTAEEISAARMLRQSSDATVMEQAVANIDCSAEGPLQGNDDPSLPLVACS